MSLPATKPIPHNSTPNQTGHTGSLANRSTRRVRDGGDCELGAFMDACRDMMLGGVGRWLICEGAIGSSSMILEAFGGGETFHFISSLSFLADTPRSTLLGCRILVVPARLLVPKAVAKQEEEANDAANRNVRARKAAFQMCLVLLTLPLGLLVYMVVAMEIL